MKARYVTRFPQYQPSGRTVDGKRVAVGVDIDGCVDPGMYKHETGFALASIFHYKLQMITPVAVRAWMFANCYSLDRGVSRFVSLYKWADILANTPFVQQSGVKLPQFKYLKRWTEVTKSLSPEALSTYLSADDFQGLVTDGESTEDVVAELGDVLTWSKRVDSLSREASENLLAFPNAVKVIRKLDQMGVDVCAVSGTPEKHVISQLEKYGIIDCFRAIFSQQSGKKNLALTAIMAGGDSQVSQDPLLNRVTAN